MVFETKKIHSETLSEYLLAVRESYGMSLDDVSEKTGIQKKFISFLETGHIAELPPEVYVCGFLRKLAHVYVIPEEDIISQYKRERTIATNIEVSGHKRTFSLPKFVITPKVFSIGLVAIFVLGTLGYVGFQLKSLSKDPVIRILEPQNNAKLQDSFVKVRGTTDPGNIVTLNSENIFVKEDGAFETTISVAPGETQLVLQAKNKFDKTSTSSVSIIREIAVDNKSVTASSLPLQLAINALNPISIRLTVDGSLSDSISLAAGERKEFSAKDSVLLSTSDGGNTKVSVNGKDLGILGKPGQSMDNIPFRTDSSAILGASTTKK